MVDEQILNKNNENASNHPHPNISVVKSDSNDYVSLTHKGHVIEPNFIKRRFATKRNENSEKFKELVSECHKRLEELRTAVEARMEQAVSGVLNSMAQFIENSSDKQRAMFRADAASTVASVIRELGASSAVCEKALIVAALLCRHNDDNKASVSYENAKALGLAGMCELVVAALVKYSLADDNHLVILALDTIRCMCCLESNQIRFADAGACEVVGRSLTKYSESPEMCGWISRALGHLTASHDSNRELVGSVGACENIILMIQKFQRDQNLCTEACWAIRNIAPTENNRARFANEHGPETIAAIFKYHTKSEIFAIEACRSLVSMIANENDDIIPRIAFSGLLSLVFKSLKRNSDSEVLAHWTFNLMYYVACDTRLISRLISCDIIPILSQCFDNHSSYEPFAEWALKAVPKLADVEGALPKMRNVGLCEVTVSAVQRQAISSTVSSHGCLAIGSLATDLSNHDRLSTAGASEAVVVALKRHDKDINVVVNACHAIHFLCGTVNIVSWMGANGACEAVTNALIKHIAGKNIEVILGATRAIGSLAFHDEGNLKRFYEAKAPIAVVRALKLHMSTADVARFSCRAIYNLCFMDYNVSELGSNAACSLVVNALQTHLSDVEVASQACLAIHGLAVKVNQDRIHNGNTRKLVAKGAIENVLVAMQIYPTNQLLQQSCALAIASLGKIEVNRNSLSSKGACELIVSALSNHSNTGSVVGKLCLAIEVLCFNHSAMNISSDPNQLNETESLTKAYDKDVSKKSIVDIQADQNKNKFANGKIIEIIINIIQKFEKDANVVADCFRAMVIMLSHKPSRRLLRADTTIKQVVKSMKLHEKDISVARYGCNLLYTYATDENIRARLGNVRACEVVIGILIKHCEADVNVITWVSKAIFSLVLLESNKLKFAHSDICFALIKALKEFHSNETIAEWICADIIAIAPLEGNRNRLGLGGACAALLSTLTKHSSLPIIVKLVCECIYELSLEATNQVTFGSAGICETLLIAMKAHMTLPDVLQQICRSIAVLSRNNMDNGNKFISNNIVDVLYQSQKTHFYHTSFTEWSCAAIASIANGSINVISSNSNKQSINMNMNMNTKTLHANANAQTIFGEGLICENVFNMLKTHKTNEHLVGQICKTIRALTFDNHIQNKSKFSSLGVIGSILSLLKLHISNVTIVENGVWILTHIPTPAYLFTIDPYLVPNSMNDKNDMKDWYKTITVWDLLALVLQTHYLKENTSKYILQAIQVFAKRGGLVHLPMCEAVIVAIQTHVEKDKMILFHILLCVGFLSHGNPENAQRFHKSHILEVLDTILTRNSNTPITTSGSVGDPELMYSACFQALNGLIISNEHMKQKFLSYPSLIKNTLHVLYDDLESEVVSRHGCEVISNLSQGNRFLQVKLNAVGNYLIDIAQTHYKSIDIITHVCIVVVRLCHRNISNRNRIGSTGLCEDLPKLISNLANLPIKGTSSSTPAIQLMLSSPIYYQLLLWAVRAIAELAANNPNNQSKLGIGGACELCCAVLKKALHYEATSSSSESLVSTTLIKWTCWAIGNLVQLGKGSTMIINDGYAIHTNAPLNNTTNMNLGSPSGLHGPNIGMQLKGIVKNISNYNPTKNTSRFNANGIVELLNSIITKFSYDSEVLQWTCRAINNLSKSKTLKSAFIEIEVLRSLQQFKESTPSTPVKAMNENRSSSIVTSEECKYWIQMCIQTLEQSDEDASEKVTMPPHPIPSSSSSRLNNTGKKISNLMNTGTGILTGVANGVANGVGIL